MKRFALVVVALLVAVPGFAQFTWPQWGLNAQHTGQTSVVGQNLYKNYVNIVYDPLVPQEMAGTAQLYGDSGELLAHYQAPLVDGNDVYMMFKDGTYSNRNYATQKWGESKYSWSGGTLVKAWDFGSDWDPPGSAYDFWEPVFHPALANGVIYVPGQGGSVYKVNKSTGVPIVRLNPFPTDDGGVKGNIFVTSPITVDQSGNLYYTAIQFTNVTNIFGNDVTNSWLVKITAADAMSTVSFSTIITGAPAATDLCASAFPAHADGTIVDGPWPPSPTAVPPSVTCGGQRAGINAAPAVDPNNGTIYVISRAHFISRWAYLAAVNPNLTPKWTATLRNRFKDGCGVPISLGGTLPPNGAPGGCRVGANYGVDPATNSYGGGRVYDDQSSSPVIAPDGSVIFGSFSRYNYDQGQMMRFLADGTFAGHYFFGWDVTPGIYAHSGTFSIITKENRYGNVGSYCNDPTFCPAAENSNVGRAYPEEYFVTQLSPTLRADALADRGDPIMTVEWRYKNSNPWSCRRAADGSVSCVSDHPNGFEWCVNGFVVDGQGSVYANSEDGWLFKVQQGGTVNATGCAPGPSPTASQLVCGGKIFQQLALGAAYTPTSIGGDGKIYSQNAGHLFVAGNGN